MHGGGVKVDNRLLRTARTGLGLQLARGRLNRAAATVLVLGALVVLAIGGASIALIKRRR